jgi:hypothetical protein
VIGLAARRVGTLFVDRFLYTPMRYPGNYGFVPHTLSDDGDPIDVLVANSRPIAPGAVTQLQALHEKTARLPQAPLAAPTGAYGKTTESAIQQGVFYGIRGLVKEVVASNPVGFNTVHSAPRRRTHMRQRLFDARRGVEHCLQALVPSHRHGG